MSSCSRTRAAAGRRMHPDLLRPRLVTGCPAPCAVTTATPAGRRMSWGPLRPSPWATPLRPPAVV